MSRRVADWSCKHRIRRRPHQHWPVVAKMYVPSDRYAFLAWPVARTHSNSLCLAQKYMLLAQRRRLCLAGMRTISSPSSQRTCCSVQFRRRQPREEGCERDAEPVHLHCCQVRTGRIHRQLVQTHICITIVRGCAVSGRIVLAQLEGSGRGSLASYNAAAYKDLTSFLEANPVRDSEAWLSELLKKNEMLGVVRYTVADSLHHDPRLPPMPGSSVPDHQRTLRCRSEGHGSKTRIRDRGLRMGEHEESVLERPGTTEHRHPPAARPSGVHASDAGGECVGSRSAGHGRSEQDTLTLREMYRVGA